MKYAYALIACLFSTILWAQKPFEGKIVYQMTAPGNKPEGNLTLSFIPNHIRLQFQAKKSADAQDDGEKDIIIINLDSGKVFTINPDDKTYHHKLLQRLEKQGPVQSITIAGHKASPIDLSEVSPLGLLGSIMSMGQTTIYASDNLYFPVPDHYKANAELAMIFKGRIILGAKVVMKNPGFAEDTASKNEMQLMAIEVSPQKMNRKDFLIPEGYTLNDTGTWDGIDSLSMMDSTVAFDTTYTTTTTDTTMIESVEQEGTKNFEKQAAKKPAPAKTPAKKKKGSKSSPARKED